VDSFTIILMLATFIHGLGAGLCFDVALVKLPTRHRIGIIPLQTFFKYISKKLNHIRKRLIDYPYNPLLWLELARLHSILGNNLKAERSLSVGHTLSNGVNRTITRAYSRFFYHIGETDKAHEIIRKSPLILSDPWIMSAEISYSIKRNRFSPNIKKGIELIDSKNYASFEISELASMVGTIELHNGSAKNAKKFVQKSLEAPNDNSLAQAEWLSRHIDHIGFSFWLEKVDFAFEAKAHEYLYEKKFPESLKEGFNWVIDQPFSKRAVQFSSYIACALLNDQKSAIEICNFGLRSNPENFEIINNLVYATALDNQIIEAKEWLSKSILLAHEEKHKIFIYANEGLIHFREKNPELGRISYKKAFELAEKLKEENLKYSAQVNLLRQEYLCNALSKERVISFFKMMGKNKTSFQVSAEIQAILKEMNIVN
jgi:tetratricopeptide (TPR) repeat protein